MACSNILVSVEDRIATLTVNRPRVRNALNVATVHECHAALAELALNAASRVDLDSGLLIETLAQAICYDSEDKREGTMAFLEKRSRGSLASRHINSFK